MTRVIAALSVLVFARAELTFLAIADWGGKDHHEPTTKPELKNGRSMADFAATDKIAHTLLVGDNFYNKGIKTDASDPRFGETFVSTFNYPSLRGLPFYVVAGNHDYHGNVSAQIEYTKHSNVLSWQFPDYYYTFTVPIPNQNGDSARFIMIDTVMLTGLSDHDEETDTYTKAEGPLNAQDAQQQMAWIEAQLSAATEKYVFVAGHYPVYSGCPHGSTEMLVTWLRPLMMKYNVSAYLSGHDHCIEHLQEPGHSLRYILVGAGKECCNAWVNGPLLPAGVDVWHISQENAGDIAGGWASLTLNETVGVVTYRDDEGVPLYVGTFSPRY